MADMPDIFKIIDDGMKKRDRSVTIFLTKEGYTHLSIDPYPAEEIDISLIEEAREHLGKCLDINICLNTDVASINILRALSCLDRFLKGH